MSYNYPDGCSADDYERWTGELVDETEDEDAGYERLREQQMEEEQ